MCSGSARTCVKRLRKERGSPLRPPPCCNGFWQPKTRKLGGHSNEAASSGMKTVARWSRHALSPSSTACGAKLSSSRITQAPARSAAKKAPSCQAYVPAGAPSTGRSEPSRSIRSVCSDRLMRTTGWPHAAPSAWTSDVLPTPGLPSSRTGLRSCIARKTRNALARGVGAASEMGAGVGGTVPIGTKKGARPNRRATSPAVPSVGPGTCPGSNRGTVSLPRHSVEASRSQAGSSEMSLATHRARTASRSAREADTCSPIASTHVRHAPCTNAPARPRPPRVALTNPAHASRSRRLGAAPLKPAPPPPAARGCASHSTKASIGSAIGHSASASCISTSPPDVPPSPNV
eukprot:scaffold1394_cov109-Isochrysis_galbana.AAC.29